MHLTQQKMDLLSLRYITTYHKRALVLVLALTSYSFCLLHSTSFKPLHLLLVSRRLGLCDGSVYPTAWINTRETRMDVSLI